MYRFIVYLIEWANLYRICPSIVGQNNIFVSFFKSYPLLNVSTDVPVVYYKLKVTNVPNGLTFKVIRLLIVLIVLLCISACTSRCSSALWPVGGRQVQAFCSTAASIIIKVSHCLLQDYWGVMRHLHYSRQNSRHNTGCKKL